MENQGQNAPKASPLDTPVSPERNFYDSDSNEPQAPNTSLSPEHVFESSESSEEEAEVHLPDTHPSGVPSFTNIPGLGPRPVIPGIGQQDVPRIGQQGVPRIGQQGVPRIGQQGVMIPGIGSFGVNPPTISKQETGQQDVPPIGQQGVMIPGIGSYGVNPPTMSKQERGLPRNAPKDYGDFNPTKITIVPTSKPLPSIGKEAANPPTMLKQETGLPSRTLKHDGDLIIPAATVSDSKLSTGIGQQVAATQPVASIIPGQKPLPSFSDIPKSDQRKGYHETPTSEKAVALKTFPSINPQPTATSPYTKNFKFTLNAPVPHEPGHSPATERFSFTQESKARLEETDSAPARRPAFKPTIFTKPKDPAQSHHIPLTVSALNPIDKASVAEPSTPAPQAEKSDEVPVFFPIKTSLPEPSDPANQAKKSIEEPQLNPTKPPLANTPALTRQASQPTESTQLPEVKPPVETGYKRSTTKDVESKGEKANAVKKVDPAVMREMIAQKVELRSQRDAVAREKASLETRVYRLTNEVKNIEGREKETKKAMSAQSKEFADLKTENDRLKKEMEVLSLLPAPKPEQETVSTPAPTEISGKSNLDGDLLAKNAAEIDALKDETKQLKKKERDLKASTAAEVLELKAKLRKAEDGLIQKNKDDENTSKRMDRHDKKIKDLSDELTKIQISKNKIEVEFRAQTVMLRKAQTREAELSSKENGLRQRVEESEAEAKLARDQAEKLKKDLEASKDEIKAAKTQNDKLAKDIGSASSDPRIRKIEALGASQTPPNRVDGATEGGEQTTRDLRAENENLREQLKLAIVMRDLKSVEIAGLKTPTPTQPEGASSEEENQKICDLTAKNETLRKELEEIKLIGQARSIEVDGLGAVTSPSEQHKEISSSEEDKEKIRKLTADNEALREEINDSKKTSNERIESLTAENNALAENCQDMEKNIAAQTDKVGKLSASNEEQIRKLTTDNEALREEINDLKARIESLIVQNNALVENGQDMNKKIAAQTDKVGELSALNEELSRKLKISKEVEARALRNLKKFEETQEYFEPFRTSIAEQEKKIADLRAKLAEEVQARHKSDSRANLLEKKLAAQTVSLREVANERAELMGKVSEQEATLTLYQDARKSVTVEAELEVTKATMESNRVRLENADAMRAQEIEATLSSMEQNEARRRQELADELEAKSRSLLDANVEIKKLKEELAASKEATEAARAEVAAASASASAPKNPSQSSTSSPPSETSPSPEISPGSGHPSPPHTTSTSSATTATCIQIILSPGRLLIFLFILGLAFLVPYKHSRALAQQSAEERDMWRAADEISRREIMDWSLRDQGIAREEARLLATWDS